ncbi:AAA family ATPase [Puniceicoccaceae bacterium K14]|nr:AAA family ATPase [Puniceicoccaceae bacterium K14]
MSDEKDPKNPIEELQKNLQDILKQGKGFMPFPGGGLGNMGAAAPTGNEPAIEKPEEDDPERDEILQRIRDFNFKPKEIRDYLDRFVIQQKEAKKVISVAICDHYNHVRSCLKNPEIQKKDYAKQNTILLGPTGVGKTYLMRNVAKLIGVPFVKADATKFSETGYVGGDVEDLVRDLVKAANGDVELAQYGIIYIDEIDKVANSSNQSGGRDVSGRGVQINLLKLMEETDVNLQSQTDIMGQMQAMMNMGSGSKKQQPKSINTRHMLFIVSGAFVTMEDAIKKRIKNTSLGFGQSPEDMEDRDSYLNEAETKDFIDYGFEPEFVGRLPVRVACNPLQSSDLLEILKTSEGSILNQYISDFSGYEIDLNISEDSLHEIAAKAYKEKTGARGLLTVLERVFRNYKFELPSTSIKKLDIEKEAVLDPDTSLKRLLKENMTDQRGVLQAEIRAFTQRFAEKYSFTLKFTYDAVETLIDESIDTDKTIRALCEKKFRDFHHGLTLISRNTGQIEFEINKTVVQNSEKELSSWVVASYRGTDNTTSQ